MTVRPVAISLTSCRGVVFAAMLAGASFGFAPNGARAAELIIALYADQGVVLNEAVKPIVRRPGAAQTYPVERNAEGYWSTQISAGHRLSNILRISVPAGDGYVFRELEIDVPITGAAASRWEVPIGIAKAQAGLPWIHNNFDTYRNPASFRAQPVRHAAILYQKFADVAFRRWDEIARGDRNLIDADLKIAYLHIGTLSALLRSNVSVINADVFLQNFAFFPRLADQQIVDRYRQALESHSWLAQNVFGNVDRAREVVTTYDAAKSAIFRGKYTSLWRFIVSLVRNNKCAQALPLILDYSREIDALTDLELPIKKAAVSASYNECVANVSARLLNPKSRTPANVARVKLHLEAARKLAKRTEADTSDPVLRRRIKMDARFLANIQRRLKM